LSRFCCRRFCGVCAGLCSCSCQGWRPRHPVIAIRSRLSEHVSFLYAARDSREQIFRCSDGCSPVSVGMTRRRGREASRRQPRAHGDDALIRGRAVTDGRGRRPSRLIGENCTLLLCAGFRSTVRFSLRASRACLSPGFAGHRSRPLTVISLLWSRLTTHPRPMWSPVKGRRADPKHGRTYRDHGALGFGRASRDLTAAEMVCRKAMGRTCDAPSIRRWSAGVRLGIYALQIGCGGVPVRTRPDGFQSRAGPGFC